MEPPPELSAPTGECDEDQGQREGGLEGVVDDMGVLGHQERDEEVQEDDRHGGRVRLGWDVVKYGLTTLRMGDLGPRSEGEGPRSEGSGGEGPRVKGRAPGS